MPKCQHCGRFATSGGYPCNCRMVRTIAEPRPAWAKDTAPAAKPAGSSIGRNTSAAEWTLKNGDMLRLSVEWDRGEPRRVEIGHVRPFGAYRVVVAGDWR